MPEEQEKLRSIEGMPEQRADPGLYRIIVLAVAMVAVAGILGGILLAWFGKTMPDNIATLAAVAVGALAGTLIPVTK